ncbi:MAG: universal stress protein [Mycetocola sp.]
MSRSGVGRPITIGVVDKQEAALAFAAEEARLSGCDLQVVHAYVVPPRPPHAMSTAYGFDIDGSFRESGRDVLESAIAFLTHQAGDLKVQPVLQQGQASTVLLDASTTSRLLVLGPDDSTPWYARLFQSRVARRLTHDAPCPVVVVPDTWSAQVGPRGITLLLDGETLAHGPLRFAFEEAARHHDVLHIIHLQSGHSPHEEAVRGQDVRRLIESWRATYPQVWVRIKNVEGDADLATVTTFERTGMLVLGRSHTVHDATALHRPLARLVIEHADCPVAVVPADYDV